MYNFILILFFLYGCEVTTDNKSLLTNNGCKYWRLHDTGLKSKERITIKNQATNNGFNW